MCNDEVTYYRFLSEIKSFLAKLLGDPIKAEPSKFLKDLGFTRGRIINLLIKKDVLERNEKILTPDKTGFKKVKYNVTYKVKKKNFDRIMRRIYTRYFEKNVPQKEELNEEMEIQSVFTDEDKMKEDILKNEEDKEMYITRGGMKGIDECEGAIGGDIAGATSCSTSSGQYVRPFSGYLLTRQQLAQTRKKNKDYVDPTKILGKNISENKKETTMGRKIYLTEAQFNYILKEEAMAAAGATSTSSVGAETSRGDIGYDAPAFGKSKNTRKNKKEKGTDGDFFKPAMEREPGFSCKTVGDGK